MCCFQIFQVYGTHLKQDGKVISERTFNKIDCNNSCRIICWKEDLTFFFAYVINMYYWLYNLKELHNCLLI